MTALREIGARFFIPVILRDYWGKKLGCLYKLKPRSCFRERGLIFATFSVLLGNTGTERVLQFFAGCCNSRVENLGRFACCGYKSLFCVSISAFCFL